MYHLLKMICMGKRGATDSKHLAHASIAEMVGKFESAARMAV